MGKLNSISGIDTAKQVAALAGGVCGRHFEAPAPLERDKYILFKKSLCKSRAKLETRDKPKAKSDSSSLNS
jgi:hypothetical protein